ncbi:MAG: type II toxin-antitoxin system HicA family toxin [Candidatus Poribacteria bacterium]|nr:type II toxin-antitoxin system HicA family toxin [Candidatus Poribacteria bacterium]MDD9973785.1 type II toxin-antitoxin system HicA family toxin [Candidatus Poribacteria bacterium]MDE0324243.1 type II toxin-antitoxin system HicA family toxin [Candidatus Poribacteria bacterium]
MRRDKLLERMRNNPHDDWRITHIETLAERYGFSMNRPRGGSSHVTLRHDSGERLTIPARRPIKAAYIRQLVQAIDQLER